MFKPFTRSLVEEAGKVTSVVSQTGQWSKNSSPRFFVVIEESQTPDLDSFFGGPVNDVARKAAYHREAAKK